MKISKKVLVISSTSRNGGNSDVLCDALIEGVKEAGNEAVKLNAGNMKISPCRGCDCCMKNGGKCVQNDDMTKVIEEMQKSDAVVFATPIYFYNLCSQLKAVFDRTYCIYQKVNFKKTVFIATSGDSRPQAMDTAIAGYKGYLSCLTGVEDAGIIIAPGVNAAGEVKGKEVIEKARKLGRSL